MLYSIFLINISRNKTNQEWNWKCNQMQNFLCSSLPYSDPAKKKYSPKATFLFIHEHNYCRRPPQKRSQDAYISISNVVGDRAECLNNVRHPCIIHVARTDPHIISLVSWEHGQISYNIQYFPIGKFCERTSIGAYRLYLYIAVLSFDCVFVQQYEVQYDIFSYSCIMSHGALNVDGQVSRNAYTSAYGLI